MEEKIIEFTFRPKTEPKKIMPTLVALIIVSAFLVVLSVTAPLYRGLISLAAVIGITISLYLFIRYSAGDYVYAVGFDGEGHAVFTVVRTVGKRASTMCCLHLTNFRYIKKMTREELRQYKADKDIKKYNFCPNFSPDTVWLIRSEDRSDKNEILVEITDEVMNRLLEYSRIAKETEPLE